MPDGLSSLFSEWLEDDGGKGVTFFLGFLEAYHFFGWNFSELLVLLALGVTVDVTPMSDLEGSILKHFLRRSE